MNNLPKGWVGSSIADVTQYVQRGKSPKYVGYSNLPVINQKCVQWSGVDETHLKYVDPSQWSSWGDERFLTYGDILWNSTGTGTIGRAAIFKGLKTSPNAVADSHVTILRPNGAVMPEFLYRLIESPSVQLRLDDMQSGSTNQVELSKGEVLTTLVPLPPLAEQRRIVTKIDSLTSKSKRARDHLDHIPRLVEKYKQAILAAAFRGDLCVERQSPKLLPLSEFVDTLNQGWSPKCVSEPAGSTDWGIIKTTAIQPIKFLPQENKRLPADLKPRPGIIINAGDVLITRAGPRSRVAISCLVTENYPKLMLCDKAYRLRINPEMADPAFVTYMLNAPQCLSELEVMKTGISDSGLNLTQAKFMALALPAFSLPEQSEIIRRIQSAFTWIEHLTADATSACKLIDHLDQSVLAKAFTGELVPQDPADEPASVVLSRIQAERAAAPKAKRGRKKAD